MLRMCRNLGFAVTTDLQDASIADVVLRLCP
jgi:hypothetical protein